MNGTKRYQLPESDLGFSGWKDYDRIILSGNLSLVDKVTYLEKRLELVFFNSFDRVYLNTAPQHVAVNGSNMSFFIIRRESGRPRSPRSC